MRNVGVRRTLVKGEEVRVRDARLAAGEKEWVLGDGDG
jgi:hypothetical protein